jgi:hypothetical protein
MLTTRTLTTITIGKINPSSIYHEIRDGLRRPFFYRRPRKRLLAADRRKNRILHAE